MTVLSNTGGKQVSVGLSPDEIEQMRRLWEGAPEMTAAMIAREFGVTKNVVIGHRHRGGWKMRKPAKKEITTLPQRLAALDIFPPSGHCVYPIGEPGKEGFTFCAAPVTEVGEPYCHDHDAKCRPSANSERQRALWEADPERKLKAAERLRERGGYVVARRSAA